MAVSTICQRKVLIAYLKPYISRRFGLVSTDELVIDQCTNGYSAGIFYLKNVFPRVDCRILLVDEVDFINANFQALTEHFIMKDYNKLLEFPNVIYNNTMPNSTSLDTIKNLRDCLCRTICHHSSELLRRYNKKVIKLRQVNKDNFNVHDKFMIPPSFEDMENLLNDYILNGNRDGKEISITLQRGDRLILIELNDEDGQKELDEHINKNILIRHYPAKNLFVYVVRDKVESPITSQIRLIKVVPQPEHYSELSANSSVSVVQPSAPSKSKDVVENLMVPWKKRYLQAMTKIEKTASKIIEEVKEQQEEVKEQQEEVKEQQEEVKEQHEEEEDNIEIIEVNENEEIRVSEEELEQEQEEIKIEIVENGIDSKTKIQSNLREERWGSVITESNEEGLLLIGDSGTTKIPIALFENVKEKKYSAMTRAFLQYLFTREVLATSSMTGKMSPAFLNTNKVARKPLDPVIVKDIVKCVSQYYNVSETLIRSIITTKCADEHKMRKMREMKKKRKKKSSK